MSLNCKIITRNFRWYNTEGIYVTGQMWTGNQYLDGKQFAEKVNSFSDSYGLFKEFLSALNGQLSLIVKKENEVWVYCGHTWSYPVFYSLTASQLILSDHPGEIKKYLAGEKINSDVIPYFLNFGVTPASKTLLENVSQVRPGEVIRIDLQESTLHNCLLHPERSVTPVQTPEETGIILHRTFDKYSRFLQHKKVLLPLTRGYDSRLLACLLKESGIRNVICATWGRETCSERETAEKVARTIGFQHIFIPYTTQATAKFPDDETFIRYVDYAGHFSSMPYLQDFFAARQLLKSGVIDEETVVLPGHPGDFLRGSHLYGSLLRQSQKEVAENIITSFGTSYPLKKQEYALIRKQIIGNYFESENNRQNFDNWDYEERQCKFIGNSSLVWSFFNIPFLMPLFDREILLYFLNLPFEQRLGSRFFNQTAEMLIFKPNRCDFDLKSPVTPMKGRNALKEKLIKYTPGMIKKRYYPLNDDVCYHELTGELIKSNPENKYRNPVKPHFFNCYLVQWYLKHVETGLKHSGQ